MVPFAENNKTDCGYLVTDKLEPYEPLIVAKSEASKLKTCEFFRNQLTWKKNSFSKGTFKMFWTRLAKLLYDVFNISELACQKEDTTKLLLYKIQEKGFFFCIFNLSFPKAHNLPKFLFACLFVFFTFGDETALNCL